MSGKLELYFFPGSYYSMKALYALYLKNIPFTEHKVNIHNGDEASDWYLKITPHGEVPCLKDGDTTVIESEDIVEYIDKKYPDVGPRFLPDEGTALCQEVRDMRAELHAIHIDYISFGVLCNQRFCVGVETPRFPAYILRKFKKDHIRTYFENGFARLRADIVKRPHFKEQLTRKLKIWEDRCASTFDEVKLARLLDELDNTFDQLEQRLIKTAAVAGNEADAGQWLLGEFTACDITCAILVTRLYDLGVDERYFSPTKRPVVYEYYKRLMAMPATAKITAMKRTIAMVYMRTAARDFIKKVAPYGIAAGVVAAAAIAYYKYRH